MWRQVSGWCTICAFCFQNQHDLYKQLNWCCKYSLNFCPNKLTFYFPSLLYASIYNAWFKLSKMFLWTHKILLFENELKICMATKSMYSLFFLLHLIYYLASFLWNFVYVCIQEPVSQPSVTPNCHSPLFSPSSSESAHSLISCKIPCCHPFTRCTIYLLQEIPN